LLSAVIIVPPEQKRFVLYDTNAQGLRQGPCQIVFQELNDKAQAKVIRSIALDSTFDSFTDACTWPDHPRKRADEHFITLVCLIQTIKSPTCLAPILDVLVALGPRFP
jgi:hypothetical protein